MKHIWRAVALAMLLVRIWKHLQVVRFFRRARPEGGEAGLVSILQPILSGDPTLPDALRANLRARSRYAREFIWLIDDDDAAAQAICGALIAEHPDVSIALLPLPPPGARENPKTIKLIAGLGFARGDVICVLDDDTRLPDGGLEQCLPYLDEPGVGLAFGLPFYTYFGNLWSSLVTLFVNSQSLLTYVPYTALSAPFTINGMFYMMRRSTLEALGGFTGLEHIVADDFAVATRFRQGGYQLAQTPLRHAIATHVTGPRHYLSLIQRWFIFPRESLLRHLSAREQAVIYGTGVAPALFPLALLIALLRPSRFTRRFAALYWAATLASNAHINAAYLGRATPAQLIPAMPLIELIFPLQLLAALAAPQRIVWRGHIMEVEQGGGLRMVRRRESGDSAVHE